MSVEKYLHSKRIVSIKISDDKKSVELIDGCDEYFSASLSKKELYNFIDELNLTHDNLID